MSNRKNANLVHETPLALHEIIARLPAIPARTIYHVTKKCTAVDGEMTGSGNRRDARYFLSEVEKKLTEHQNRRPAGSEKTGYVEDGTHWIPRVLLTIDAGTADAWAAQEKTRKPRLERVHGLKAKAKFWPKEDILDELKKAQAPLSARKQKPRSPTEIKTLDRNEFISFADAKVIGFDKTYLFNHTQFPPKIRRKQKPEKNRSPIPAPPIGRLIQGGWMERASIRHDRRGNMIQSPTVKLGDLLDILDARDNPPIPTGGLLIKDALARLEREHTPCSRSHLTELIKDRVIRGGQVEGFKSNFSPEKLWWMQWEDRTKIPAFDPPGTRRYWIDGRDVYPLKEAIELSGLQAGQAFYLERDWTPIEHGGFGRPCPHLDPPRPLQCAIYEVDHRFGDTLLIYFGDELRCIAQTVTGTLPPAPKAPKNIKPQRDHIGQKLDQIHCDLKSRAERVESLSTTILAGTIELRKFLKSAPTILGVQPGAAPDKEMIAAAMLKENPTLSDRKIAAAAGCSHTTLSRSNLYQQVKAAIAVGGPPTGRKESKTRRIEAFTDAPEDDDQE